MLQYLVADRHVKFTIPVVVQVGDTLLHKFGHGTKSLTGVGQRMFGDVTSGDAGRSGLHQYFAAVSASASNICDTLSLYKLRTKTVKLAVIEIVVDLHLRRLML